jgi:MYXO-CTERM domain-containing protein
MPADRRYGFTHPPFAALCLALLVLPAGRRRRRGPVRIAHNSSES